MSTVLTLIGIVVLAAVAIGVGLAGFAGLRLLLWRPVVSASLWLRRRRWPALADAGGALPRFER